MFLFPRIYGGITDGLLSFGRVLMNCGVFICRKIRGILLFHEEKNLEIYYEHQFLTPFTLDKINVRRHKVNTVDSNWINALSTLKRSD